jgi:hypothetical protein
MSLDALFKGPEEPKEIDPSVETEELRRKRQKLLAGANANLNTKTGASQSAPASIFKRTLGQ